MQVTFLLFIKKWNQLMALGQVWGAEARSSVQAQKGGLCFDILGPIKFEHFLWEPEGTEKCKRAWREFHSVWKYLLPVS